eukprot:13558882-Alexandrium_andersonii.AAC.1
MRMRAPGGGLRGEAPPSPSELRSKRRRGDTGRKRLREHCRHDWGSGGGLSLIHISEPTRLALI